MNHKLMPSYLELPKRRHFSFQGSVNKLSLQSKINVTSNTSIFSFLYSLIPLGHSFFRYENSGMCWNGGGDEEHGEEQHVTWFLSPLPIPNFYYLLVSLVWIYLRQEFLYGSGSRGVGWISILPPHHWQRQETFLVVTAGGGVCYWHLVGRERGCC